MLYPNPIYCDFYRVKHSLRRGLLYPFNYGSAVGCRRKSGVVFSLGENGLSRVCCVASNCSRFLNLRGAVFTRLFFKHYDYRLLLQKKQVNCKNFVFSHCFTPTDGSLTAFCSYFSLVFSISSAFSLCSHSCGVRLNLV